MTISVIPVGDTREALALPSIPQTAGRRQHTGGRGGWQEEGILMHTLNPTHTHTYTHTQAHISH